MKLRLIHALAPTLALCLASAACDRHGAPETTSTSADTSPGASAAPGGGRKIAVGEVRTKIGDAARFTRVRSETIVEKPGGKGGQQTTKTAIRNAKSKEECIALDVGRCNSLRVRYDEDVEGIDEESVTVDATGAPQGAPKRTSKAKTPHVVQGKTYRVTVGRAEAAVEREGSGKVDDDELKALRKRFSRKGRDEDIAFRASIPAEVAVGQSLEATAAVHAGQLAAKVPGAKVDATCTVIAIRDEGERAILVLDVRSTLTADTPKGAVELKLAATLELRADTRFEQLSVTHVDTKISAPDGKVTTSRLEERIEAAPIASFDDTVPAGAKR